MKTLEVYLELLLQLTIYLIAGDENFDLVKVQVKIGRRYTCSTVQVGKAEHQAFFTQQFFSQQLHYKLQVWGKLS